MKNRTEHRRKPQFPPPLCRQSEHPRFPTAARSQQDRRQVAKQLLPAAPCSQHIHLSLGCGGKPAPRSCAGHGDRWGPGPEIPLSPEKAWTREAAAPSKPALPCVQGRGMAGSPRRLCPAPRHAEAAVSPSMAMTCSRIWFCSTGSSTRSSSS